MKIPITKKDWWGDSRCRPWVPGPVSQKKILLYLIFILKKRYGCSRMQIWQ
jgi:hypothetical protein